MNIQVTVNKLLILSRTRVVPLHVPQSAPDRRTARSRRRLSPAALGQGWRYPISIRSQNAGWIRSAKRECRMKRATITNRCSERVVEKLIESTLPGDTTRSLQSTADTSGAYRVNRTAHSHSNMLFPMHHTTAPAFTCLFGERVPRSPAFAEPETSICKLATLNAPPWMLKQIGLRFDEPVFE